MTAHATPPPFSDPQWRQVRQLLGALDERQRWWLSGYLTATGTAPDTAAARTDAPHPVLIGYGTETDNCRQLARLLSERCGAAGIATEVIDLARLRPRQLARRDHLVIITATHGDGDPPEPIQAFYQGLMSDDAPKLDNLKFAVLALGDSSYERFCVTGQEFDQRLEALGGERLIARQDCDVDFEQLARDWIARLLEALPKTGNTDAAPGPSPAPASSPFRYDKHHPLTVEVLVNQNLSAADRRQPIHHLELALDQAIPDLLPGDAVGILADNPPELVAAVLDACELSGEQPVTLDGDAQPLVQALRQSRDLTIVGTGFLTFWAEHSNAPALKTLCEAESREQRAFLRQHQLLDLLSQYPAHAPAQALVNALRPLQPRLYDVANSLAELDDELHLTIKAFRYPFRERHEQGIASRYLLDLQPGDPVRLYPHRNTRFRLPDDDAPLILIAEGTGIAPYRAFLQALSQRPQRPPCWLVFAEQRFEEDFLYQLDIQQAHADGVLEQVDTVFYQDRPGASLIDPLLNQIDRLASWIEQGAHLYLCGDKGRLSDLENSLKTALDQRQGDGAWKQLGRNKRLHRNLY
ncbi:sulfite reductase flavoprotein subunit alpha [Alcanivorax sp. 24]|uniref:diflavin oxidoreductase n=1 Tax=Alcanivorax sp. 24 TaxID=2545266 RepID=UPI00105D4F8A|nr:sulfite reductase flavoprotein subunit alpha [Alcanivorax sp. 24]